MRLLFVITISIVLLFSCKMNNKGTVSSSDTTITSHHVMVKEVLQTSSYTYLFVNENDQDYWMAASKIDARVGDQLYYNDAMEMKDFKSKELDRQFDRILFVQNISDKPISLKTEKQKISNHKGKKPDEPKEDIQVEPAPDGISIAELYKNRNNYTDKKVIVRGKVVKINNNIMNRNWVHIQDGTNDAGNYDLTVTTQENVNVGDIVTIEGTVSLNKEFGSGYSYELIVEGVSLK